MQRRHKFLWMNNYEAWDYTQDGRFLKVKIKKNEKTICRKKKRNYYKKITNKDIADFTAGIY